MWSAIRDAFDKVSIDRPDRVAIFGLSEKETRTFRELSCDARMMSQAVAAAGLPAGPCLVCSIGNLISFFPVMLAALEARAALVLLDGDGPPSHILAMARRLGAHAIVLPDDTAVSGPFERKLLPGGLCLIVLDPAADGLWRHAPEHGPVVLKMTSGSGNQPRAVVATETNLLSDARHIIEAMDIGPEDVSLAAIPLAHSYGLGNLVMPLLMQGSPIALRTGFAPRQLGQDIAACGVTTLPGVPYFFEHVRRAGEALVLASVRRLITAGAPISAETVSYFKETIARKIHSFYGSSETGGISYDDSDDVSVPLTVGRPMPGTLVDLRPWPGVQPDEGRLFVRGAAVCAAYATDQEPQDEVSNFVDGGFLTGDIGAFDSRGRIVLRRRVSRFINVAGRKVDPAEVEAVLRSLPGVVEMSVVGAPCETRGEQVVACIRRQNNALSAEDVRAHCAARLPVFKVPRRIVFVDALPVDARGKVSHRAIQTLVGEPDDAGDR
ncbi:MAG TPA: fatty acid--CoA ligase family protein [Vicinamibacterales bacterium]|nr:fatty acid--CoA ligase family protein [Vicinamibacterales bacterium]